MASSARANWLQQLKAAARQMVATRATIQGLLDQDAAVGHDYSANLTVGDIQLTNTNSALQPAQVQAFVAGYNLDKTIRTATDAATLAAALAALTTASTALYASTPPVALDSLTAAIVNG